MKRRDFLREAWLGAVALGCACRCESMESTVSAIEEAPRPNVLIIFTDDQGYGDLGCHGQEEIRTPRLDQLAGEGRRFTSFYAQAVCGPSRSALLTGRYPMRSKGWSMPASEITFAELIGEAVYQTACIGKWDASNRNAIIGGVSNVQGSDYYFGPLGANDNGRVTLYRDNKRLRTTEDMAGLTHLYTQTAIEYLKKRRDPDRPFLFYLAHTMLHMNIDASPGFKGHSEYGLYGDVAEELDYETGRLLDVVDELGLTEDTLAVFGTDNGPWCQRAYIKAKRAGERGGTYRMYREAVFCGDPGPLRNGKGFCYEGGNRVPCIMRWPGRIPEARVSDAICATIDFLPTFAHLAGFKMPDDRLIDGVDQTDLLLGRSEKGSRDHFLYGRNAIRQAQWKYLKATHSVPGYARDTERRQVEELYDLDRDIGERNNLAAECSEKMGALKERIESLMEDKHGR